MRTALVTILTICFFSLQGQTIEAKLDSLDNKKEFKNQGEQEEYRSEQFIAKNYTKQVFDKYKGDIVVEGDFFHYANQTLVIGNTSKELKAVFSKGLVYPSIVTGTKTTKPMNKEELDKMTAEQRAMYNLTRADSLTIDNLEELKSFNKSPTQKRFSFWLYRKGLHNPQVHFFELTNPIATDKTDIEPLLMGQC